MKKIISVLFCLIALTTTIPVLASGKNVFITDSITFAKNQTETDFTITVENSSRYAGAEFGVICGEGVTIKSVVYDSAKSKAGPTKAMGKTWFSFFSGNNDFSGRVTATVTVSYIGDKNTSIVVDSIDVFTKSGAGVDTERLAESKTVEIKKVGATNPIIPPKPPKDEATSSDKTDNDSSFVGSESENLIHTDESTVDNSHDDSPNLDNSISSSDVNSGEQDTSVQNQTDTTTSCDDNNPLLLIALAVSVCGNIVLLVLYINNKKKKEKK